MARASAFICGQLVVRKIEGPNRDPMKDRPNTCRTERVTADHSPLSTISIMSSVVEGIRKDRDYLDVIIEIREIRRRSRAKKVL